MQLQVRYRTPAGHELVARREVRLDLATSSLSVDSDPASHVANSTDATAEDDATVRSDADPLIPQPTATVQDLLPTQSTEPPPAPRPPALAAPAWNPQRIPEPIDDRSNVAAAPTVRRRSAPPADRGRTVRPSWKPYR
jgi:hypothetical protein